MENVGQIILSQLKTLSLNSLMAWGAQKFTTFNQGQLITEPHIGGLMFKVHGLKHKGHVVITLNGKDLYDLRIGKYTKHRFEQTGVTIKDLYAEDLIEAIDNQIEGYFENGSKIYENIDLFKNI